MTKEIKYLLLLMNARVSKREKLSSFNIKDRVAFHDIEGFKMWLIVFS